jgi:hypothetical protein
VHGKSVDIYAIPKFPQKELNNIVSPQDVNFLEKLDSNYFTISLDRGNAKIKEVKWEETNDKLRLLIFTEKGELDTTKYAMTPGSPQYDVTYAFGIKTESDVREVLAKFANVWSASETVNIDIRSENEKYAQSNFVYADAKTFAEAVFKFTVEHDYELTNEEATELLAAIYWKTNSLRNRYTTAEILSVVQSLLGKGASLPKVVTKIFASASVAEVKARQEIYNSLKLNADKIAFGRVSQETAKLLTRISPIFPAKNPLFMLRDTEASFSLVPLSENKTLVLASSVNEQINLKKLFGSYNYVGDPIQAELTFDKNVNDTEAEITRILAKAKNKENGNKPVLSEPVLKPTTPEPTPVEPKEKLEPKQVGAPRPENQKSEIKDQKTEKPTEVVEAEPIIPEETPSTDPLAPATEAITPAPAPSGNNNIAPTSDTTPFGGLGAGMPGLGAPSSDPLPPAGK